MKRGGTMETYQAVEIEIIAVDAEDVITTSDRSDIFTDPVPGE